MNEWLGVLFYVLGMLAAVAIAGMIFSFMYGSGEGPSWFRKVKEWFGK